MRIQKQTRTYFPLCTAAASMVAAFLLVGCGGPEEPPPPAELTAGPVSGFTTEAGGEASLSIHLDVAPSSDVVIELASSDASEGTIAPTSLTFTRDNFSAPQSVLITGVDDDVDDGDQSYAIDIVSIQSDDTRFAELLVNSVAVTNIDDETAGVLVGAVDGATTEWGDQASFSIVLASEPTANVVLALASDDPTEGSVSPASLTFTPSNWKAPQQVLVTGENDDQADGNQDYHITVTPSSSDADYVALQIADVPVTNVDDETAGILIDVTSATSTEGAGQAMFDVVLTSQPLDDVVVSFDSNDASEGAIGNTSLTFTDMNWNAPQTVAVVGLDDDIADGNQTYQVVFNATVSNDADYDGMTPLSVSLTNVDNDSAGISVSEPDGPTSEFGGEATFEIVLTSEPTDDVTISFDTNDPTEGTPDVTSVVFTNQDWNIPQPVTVTGMDDALNDGFQLYAITFAAVSSNDANYAALAIPSLSLVNVDDETPGFIISEPTGNTSENGGSADFTVVLTKQPTADVTVNFDTSNPAEGSPTVTSLIFTAADYDTPQTVTVNGADDGNIDGDQPYRIDFSPTTSADPYYNGLVPASVQLINADNDAMVSFNPSPSADDFVVTGSENSGSDHYVPSNGDGTFGMLSNIPNTGTVDGLDVADMDNDGDNDFLLCDGSDGTVTLFTNVGAGFSETVVATGVAGSYCTNLRIEDMDNDGALDFVVGDESTAALHIFLQTAIATFNLETTLDTSWATSNIFGVATGDVDGDNLPDVLAMGYNGAAGGEVHFYKGDGAGGAAAPVLLIDTAISSATGLAVFDVDSDGDLDIIAGGGSGGEHFLYTNDGTGTFTAVGGTAFDTNAQTGIDAFDVDGDGDQDLLVATWSTASLVWVENMGGTLAAPVTITSLGANSIGVGAPPRN